MTTITPDQVHASITAALAVYARQCRLDAGARRFTGPVFAEARKAYRDEAKRCEDIGRILEHVSPEALAALLAAKAA
jgi:hypothetical protein